MKFRITTGAKKSEVRDFIGTDKRLQITGNFTRFKGLVMHLGASTAHSKPIYLFDRKTEINEDVTWCKNMWFEWEYTDKDYIFEVLLS